MSVLCTEEQTAAIKARGNVIVSASAGSGKTFVMIERLVSLILSGADVRKVLCVTFTNKAAAQMRDRLRTALLRRICASAGEERARLKEQLYALPLADISTIHAFCARLVRTYFYLAEVDPAFAIVSKDDAEGCRLFSRALEEVFESLYAENDPAFKDLLSVYFYKNKDARLKRIVTSLYNVLSSCKDPQGVLKTTGKEDGFAKVCDYLRDDFATRARFYSENAEDVGAFFAENNDRGFAVCGEVLEAAERIASAKTLFEMVEAAKQGISVSRMPERKKFAGEAAEKYDRLKALSEGVKKLYKDLSEFATEEEERARYSDGQRLAGALAGVIARFDETYSRLKREADVLDYDDLERFALKVLSSEEARQAIAEKYEYVFVDEYQDVNPVQEEILTKIGEGEIFLVGDAKQSIYGFRGSRSEYFLQKERELPLALRLSENFRSSSAVLDAVNRVFSYAMTKESCGIDYARGRMTGGARFGGHEGGVFFRVVPKEAQEETERGVYSVLKEAKPRTDAQAEAIARLVKEELGSDWFDADAGVTRQIDYGDIAILARKKSGDAEKIVASLSAQGIPVATSAAVNVCDFWEARLLIDWLSYLDDPEQDIPFAGALLSRIGGFSERELVEIREKFPFPASFKKACMCYQKTFCDTIALKLQTFEKRTQRYRALMCVRTAAEMGNLLLSEGLEAEIAAKQDGPARLKRVRRLLSEGEGTVNEFLRRLKASAYRVEFSESGGENAVKVLTMHSAKGLEYPVVILAGMNKPFHGPDAHDVMFAEDFGFAPKSYDLENRLAFETVLRRAEGVYSRREELKGELNLFYVAMTRAKYRLYLFFEKTEQCLSPAHAKCFADFIDFRLFGREFVQPVEGESKPAPREVLFYPQKNELYEKLCAAFHPSYPFETSVSLPTKSSATEILHAEAEAREYAPLRRSGAASIDEGLAYHAFLQNVEFGKGVKEELARMSAEGLMSEEQLALLREEDLEKIMTLPAIARLAGKKIYREQKFLMRLPAREATGADADDEILLQGAIDLLYEDEKGYGILDYKYSSRSEEELKETYEPQITLYRKAVAAVFQVDEGSVRAKIVNIKLMYETEM